MVRVSDWNGGDPSEWREVGTMWSGQPGHDLVTEEVRIRAHDGQVEGRYTCECSAQVTGPRLSAEDDMVQHLINESRKQRV